MDDIANYRILARLGGGTFGSVFQAEHNDTKELVAIKVLHKMDDDAFERFEREIRLLSKLQPVPQIVTIFDWGWLDSRRPFYVMEYCRPGSLEYYLGHVNASFAGMVLMDISTALKSLDSFNGFHRDIKPANIFVDTNIYDVTLCKLGDFGLARTEDTAGVFTNNAGGTPNYMSPQALEGEPFTILDDIYSLGITVNELLFGELTRTVQKDSMLFDIRTRGLIKLLRRMMARDPRQRPSLDQIQEQTDSILYRKPAAKIS